MKTEKKFVCGKITHIYCVGKYSNLHPPKFETNVKLMDAICDMGYRVGEESYGEKLEAPIIIYAGINGEFTFRVKCPSHFDCLDFERSIIAKSEKRKYKRQFTYTKRVGLFKFKREKEVAYEQEVATYELCNEVKFICKAFAERAKRDTVEITFEFENFYDYNKVPLAIFRNFDEKIITDLPYYDEDNERKKYISDPCLIYRIEIKN